MNSRSLKILALVMFVFTLSALMYSQGVSDKTASGKSTTKMEERPKSIEAVMGEIRQDLNLKKTDQIPADKVSPGRLEELGDSVMEAMIGNPDIHDQMDNMMGGDGSASLTAMHQRIGYNYLSGYPLGMMGMMSGGYGYPLSISNKRFGGYGMMGGYGYGYGPGMMGLFGWGGMAMGLIFVIIVIALIFFLMKAASGNRIQSGSETPLDILKKRYAKGEINKDEFEQMKKDL